MAMAWIFTAMIVISVVFGMVNGTMDAVSAAALSGANDAITLTISLLGVLCLWMYSGFVYKMLGLPKSLYTPLFATARIVGWMAHRLEEVTTGGKIIRPAYKPVAKNIEYVNIDERNDGPIND